MDNEQEKIELSWGIVDKIKGEDEKLNTCDYFKTKT